ncbi:hypothetical protein IBX73_03685 [candidate division WOR-3 bacterium]|nr:hypothetical protein [candidate division WOR-3 bacterium]
MVLDDLEDTKKGPFCKPYGQLFYDNLEKIPPFQVIAKYLSCLSQAKDKIQQAITILEGVLQKGADKIKEIDEPEEVQRTYGRVTNSRFEIEKEIEHLAQDRREIDKLISLYSEKGILTMPVRDFMTIFDADYSIKVEKKRSESDELYYADIKSKDLDDCAGFDHLNKIMTGYLIKKVLIRREPEAK